MYKFTTLQRISLTALMFALDVIATRFLGIYITSTVRLSMGVCVLIFSSVLLGPISGAIVGALGDIIGILIIPGPLDINPFITLTYFFMGMFPGLIIVVFNKLFNKKTKKLDNLNDTKNKENNNEIEVNNLELNKDKNEDDKKVSTSKKRDRIGFIVLLSFLLIIFVLILVFTLRATTIKLSNGTIIEINNIAKIVIPIVAFVLMVGICIMVYFLNRHFKKKREDKPEIPSTYEIAFIVIFIEVVFTLLINSMVKSFFYGLAFEPIFFTHLLLAFIYIPFNIFAVQYLCLLSSKIVRIRS